MMPSVRLQVSAAANESFVLGPQQWAHLRLPVERVVADAPSEHGRWAVLVRGRIAYKDQFGVACWTTFGTWLYRDPQGESQWAYDRELNDAR